jgi:ethanolamine utilization microcompartment shell protein EutL
VTRNSTKRIRYTNIRVQNDMGNLSDTEVNLSTYNTEVISKFAMQNAEECNLQTYLKSIGVFTSQYHFEKTLIAKDRKVESSQPDSS